MTMSSSLFRFFFFLLALARVTVSLGTERVAFGTLRLEVRSSVPGEARSLLSELVALTSAFLDEQLNLYFVNTISENYFSHTGLGILDFALDATDDYFVARVEWDSSAYFTVKPVPSNTFVQNLVKSAFQGDSKLEYVQLLTSSRTADFLTELQYLVVQLDDAVIATEDLQYDDTHNNNNASSFWNQHFVALVGALVAATSLLLGVTVLCCICRHRRRQSSERIKTVTTNQTTQDEEPAPSPEPSIASQESSKFTYNPHHHIFYSSSTISGLSTDSRTLPSQFSQLEIDPVLNIEESWTRQNTISPITPAPFGNDISAIVKDLSLIQEETDESASSNKKLTQLALQDLDNTYLYACRKNKSMDSSMYTDSINHVSTGDHSDVIADLNNLSLQISQQRNKK